jgi:D-mycarose 3-C-methyltransferase
MKELKQCLVCSSIKLKESIDLRLQPLVNNLKDSPDQEDRIYPLIINECQECSHKQISISVDRELLFKDYLYQTGTSESHKNFFMDFADALDNKIGTGSILDIGCNDGSLLECFQYRNWKVLGIEPSSGFNHKVPVIKDYFPTDRIADKFDVITAFNVFAHNDLPVTFLLKMKELLKENGRIFILTTPARLDNFYHEHISYFTTQSMMVLAK